MRRSAALLLLIATALAAGCASRPAPRITFLNDGVLKSPTAQDAENYCRNFGAPMRFLSAEGSEVPAAQVPAGEVIYRCD
ncbi:hypothetical protein [Variovorax paradoxus]|uniref:hypothetical protein n=1 Tax=Variovorax paradoxus TaxID=34073 RepID=UPI00277DD0E8|nr:hypothetical protein [Variovorax paradoxus]MDQ0587686.1 hypothetical protein [Variovorax paradoxus]